MFTHSDPERELAVQWRPDGLQAQVRLVPTGPVGSVAGVLLDDGALAMVFVVFLAVFSAIGAATRGEAPVVIAVLTVAPLVLFVLTAIGVRSRLSQARTLTVVGTRLTIEGEGSWDLGACRRVDAWKRSLGLFGLDGRPVRTLLLAHDPAVVTWLAEQLQRGVPDPGTKTPEAESRRAREELAELMGSAGRSGER